MVPLVTVSVRSHRDLQGSMAMLMQSKLCEIPYRKCLANPLLLLLQQWATAWCSIGMHKPYVHRNGAVVTMYDVHSRVICRLGLGPADLPQLQAQVGRPPFLQAAGLRILSP